MGDKVTVSVRFGENFPDRINYAQWEELIKLQDYFKMTSMGQLAEAALHYAYTMRGDTAEPSTEVERGQPLPHVHSEKYAVLEASLQSGILEKSMRIESGGLFVSIAVGTRIKLYRPYVISFEPSYDVRFSIDISHKWRVVEQKGHITLIAE